MAEITPVSCTRKRSMSSSIQKPNWNRCLCHVKENVQGQLTALTAFGDAGLADVLVESGIVGAGSVTGVIEGRHYNRAVRTHKVHIAWLGLYRALWIISWWFLQDHNFTFNFFNRCYVNKVHNFFWTFCYFRLCLKQCTDYGGWVSSHGCNVVVTVATAWSLLVP